MGARGKTPTPGRRPHRRTKEPVPVEVPTCPKWLKGEGRAEWKRQTEQLERLGVLAKIDRALLAAYCRQWEEWRELDVLVENGERVVSGSTGSDITNPLVRQRDAALDRLAKLGAQFGFSPGSRARLNPEDVGDGKPEEGSVLAFARDRKAGAG